MRLSVWLGLMTLSICHAFPAQPPLDESSALRKDLDWKFSRQIFARDGGDEDDQGTGPRSRNACGSLDMDDYGNIFHGILPNLSSQNKSTISTLSKRMELPDPTDPDAIGHYVMQQIPRAISIYHVERVNTATYFPFDLNTDKIKKSQRTISVDINYLCGCTALIVVSRKGAYVAHYMEDISFSPSDETKAIWGPDNQVTFKRTCIEGLYQGLPCTNENDISRQPDQESLKAHAGELANGKAFIIRPSNGQKDGINPYKPKIAAIKAALRDIIPTITIAKPDTFYVAATDREKEDDKIFKDTPRGKLLLRWTPTQDKTKNNAPPNLVKIWSEAIEIYSDAW